MTDIDEKLDLKNEMRPMASTATADQVGRAFLMSVELMEVLINSDVNPEKLQIAAKFLENDLVAKCEREPLINGVVCDLSESIGMAITSLIKKENIRRHESALEMDAPIGVTVKAEEINEQPVDLFAENGELDMKIVKLDDSENEGNKEMLDGRKKRKYERINMIVDENGMYGCDICGKSYAKNYDLKIHKKRTHSDDDNERRPFLCKECGRRFSYKHHLKDHATTHLDGSDPMQAELKQPFKCDICGSRFTQASSVKNHMRIHSNDEKVSLPFKCDECGRKFRWREKLKRHMQTHMAMDDPLKVKFECDLCGKILCTEDSLILHKLTHMTDLDPDAKRPFKCNVCGDRFTTPASLRVHKRRHSEDVTKRQPYECEICGKRFSAINSYKGHKRTHIDNNDTELAEVKRPYKCELCDKRFTALPSLKGHIRTVHSNDDDPKQAELHYPFKCDVCGHRSTSSSSLKSHMRVKHATDDEIRRPYKCDVCGMRFTQHGHLKRHKDSKHSESVNRSMSLIRSSGPTQNHSPVKRESDESLEVIKSETEGDDENEDKNYN